jgi:Tol biopolymer transport system component/DNA-binding winged helix-turn-helix (wHTH) protein
VISLSTVGVKDIMEGKKEPAVEVEAIAKRGEVTPISKVLRFSVFEVNLKLRELRKHGVRIRLPAQPFAALVLLLEDANRVVTRDRLCCALWPGETAGDLDLRLNHTIHRIREALNDIADTPRIIETVPRVGYRVLIPVEHVGESTPTTAVPKQVETPTQVSPELSAKPTLPDRPWWRRNVIWAILLVTAASVTFGVIRFGGNRSVLSQDRSPNPLTTFLGAETSPSFSPDGKTVAFSWDGEEKQYFHVFLISLSGGTVKKLTDGPQNDHTPIWSPDGKQLAFLRRSENDTEIWLVKVDGSDPRKLTSIGNSSWHQRLAWTRDPKWMVTSVCTPDDPATLFVISTENGRRRRLTSPPAGERGDLAPAVSPDGRALAFTRVTREYWSDIYIVPVSADLATPDEPRSLTRIDGRATKLSWTSDSRQLFVARSSAAAGVRKLLRIDLAGKVTETGIEGGDPDVSPDGASLAYVRTNIEPTSIWKLELPKSGGSEPKQSRLVSSTRPDLSASLSPDGRRLVFTSTRSGAADLWMSEADGSNAIRITTKGATQPRWSPDGLHIVFESGSAGNADIYLYDVKSGFTRRITSGPGSRVRPSWSRDSKSLYYCSNLSGRPQIWKKPLNGTERQMTRAGALFAVEDFDAKGIYFLTADEPPAIAWAPIDGGDEIKVVDHAAGNIALAASRAGLFFFSSLSQELSQFDFYDFATKRSRVILTIPGPVHHYLNALPGGDGVLYTRFDRLDSDIMLLNLR